MVYQRCLQTKPYGIQEKKHSQTLRPKASSIRLTFFSVERHCMYIHMYTIYYIIYITTLFFNLPKNLSIEKHFEIILVFVKNVVTNFHLA